jgi:hypothetical protein
MKSAAGLLLSCVIVAFQVAVISLTGTKAKRRCAFTGHALVQISYVLPIQLSIAALVAGAATGIATCAISESDLYLKNVWRSSTTPDEMEDGRLPGAYYFFFWSGTALAACFPVQHDTQWNVSHLPTLSPATWVMGYTSHASLAVLAACFATAWIVGECDPGRILIQLLTCSVSLWELLCCVAERCRWAAEYPLSVTAAVIIKSGRL